MRRAGILLHPTALPGPGPAGDLGQPAVEFLDWLQAAGCSLWQVLPVHPTGPGLCPYTSPSAFAGAPHLLSLARLQEDGLLSVDEARPPRDSIGQVDTEALFGWHAQRVDQAADRLAQTEAPLLSDYVARTPWLADWVSWSQDRGAPAHRIQARQFLFDRQWAALRTAAHARGIQLMGDLPIFVSAGGADALARPGLFRWADPARGDRVPDPVAGVPPDYFSPEGQHWGNPLYDWATHKADGFSWWLARFARELSLMDEIRVDHFRGFSACWEIPRSAQGDARQGAWRPAEGRALFEALEAAQGRLPLLAEDLGHITPEVEALRDDFGLPGMKILQFAFGGAQDHPFLPHTWRHDNWAVYTGTHDNDTGLGWYRSADPDTQHRFRVYSRSDGQDAGWDLIRLAWASTARTAIAPLQDVLGLGTEARFNVPGQAEGNWGWRAAHLPEHGAHRLGELSWIYGRRPT